ncbi:MAG: glycine cleavage system protein GcvH [Planctomycetales bacterium]|nr:glycine cleavage system protein GcvH [Planctomycetales bacterium]
MDARQAVLKYAKSHEWVDLQGNVATIGITDFAVKELTDLVYVDLPAPGKTLAVGQPFGVIESVKAVSDLYAPVSGEVIEANKHVQNDVTKIADDPLGAGWLIKVRMPAGATLDHLLSRDAYEQAATAGH